MRGWRAGREIGNRIECDVSAFKLTRTRLAAYSIVIMLAGFFGYAEIRPNGNSEARASDSPRFCALFDVSFAQNGKNTPPHYFQPALAGPQTNPGDIIVSAERRFPECYSAIELRKAIIGPQRQIELNRSPRPGASNLADDRAAVGR